MIIFYAFTATQLINMFNIRVNICPNEDAELYADCSRIPSTVVDDILKSNIFNKVILLNQKNTLKDTNRNAKTSYFLRIYTTLKKIYYHIKHIPILRTPVSHCGELFSFFHVIHRNRLFIQPFFKYLRENPNICLCEELFVGTCGGLSPMIISILLKRVKKLEVNLVDEGIANYYLSKSEMCLEYRESPSLYIKLLARYYHLNDVFFRNILEITNKNYLLQPDSCIYSNQYLLVKIPQINRENQLVLSLLMESISEPDVELYRKQHVYYLLQKLDEKFEKCLSIVLEQINHSELLLKEHPSFRIMESLSKKYDLESVVIDKRTDAFIFEALCTHYNFDNRAIITNFSSAAFTPKYMFGFEPSIVFLYKLINSDGGRITLWEKLVDSLKKLYSNPEKIFVPETFGELSEILVRINKGLTTS